ncbi:DegV family protein [Humibacillus xanthopallidus]|uniref:DegV family protein with EDD domain n=1 Tax=Humibacillus xanthopallidus TaxID=412689 RepID=A0A543HJM2_9MICO|nr:DegV family protein [Humibacillus xanthopallidus]TQM58525.1 DegV family protein with EDD domain [Humibacillus xanthopallidus]
MTVAVVTDSTAYLPEDVVERHGIEVVPLHVIVGGRDHVEGRDVTAEQVADALRHYTIVTTSRPTPQVFAETYQRLADEGATAIVSIHLSSQMSGTIEAARLAAADAAVPVEVVDSETIGMAMGYAVIAAAESAAQGDSVVDVAAVVAAARARLERSSVLFYVDTLEHLRRGGRIGAASALLGSALAIKPILAVRGGRITPVEKVRTSSRAIARIVAMAVERVRADGLVVDIAVHHLDALGRAEQIATELRRAVPGAPHVIIVELGAVVGAHVGPGTVAIALSPRPGEPLPDPAEVPAP